MTPSSWAVWAAISLVAAGCSESSSGAPPAGCSADPLEEAACGRALDELCRSQTDASSCRSQGPFHFPGADGGNTYQCNWAASTRFADTTTCTIDSVDDVCVAVLVVDEFRCDDPCVEPGVHYGAMLASTTEPEILRLDCPPRADALIGPIDERFEASDPSHSNLSCAPGDLPAAPVDLCACQEVLCGP